MLHESLRFRLYLSVFVASLGLAMYTVFIPVFAQTFGATFFDLGLIGAVGALATATIPGLAGHMADRTDRLRVFQASLIINVLATFFLIFCHSVFDIAALRLVGGVGLGIFWPMGEALASDLAPADRRVREMGRYSISMAMGLLIGPSIGGYVAQNFGYTSLFVISSAVISISLLQSVLWVTPLYPKQVSTRTEKSDGNVRIIRSILPVYMMLICYGVVWGLISSIFPGYVNSIGINAILIGYLFSAFGVTRILSLATAHRYLKFGEKQMLATAAAMIFFGILILGAFPYFITFLVGMMIIGVSVGIVFPITSSLISHHFPDEKRGAAMGSYETAVNTGETLGPYVAGVLASLVNITSGLMLMSVFPALMIWFAVCGRPRTSNAVGPDTN